MEAPGFQLNQRNAAGAVDACPAGR